MATVLDIVLWVALTVVFWLALFFPLRWWTRRRRARHRARLAAMRRHPAGKKLRHD